MSDNGWTKEALGQMRRLDSFLKEVSRFSGSLLSVQRVALRDFGLSGPEGLTLIPANTRVAVATYRTHEDPALYIEPETFNPARFYDSEHVKPDSESDKRQLVTPTSDWVFFGTGKYACAGRFFAVNVLKAMLAHILVTYDVKFAGDPDFDGKESAGGTRAPPPVGYMAGFPLPPDSKSWRLLFRNRRDV
ncbi:hypothetical protein V5O48_013961 [Marasmius crinis-equi]|uniref:Cytochrome P450 n=1 Tax=Marasmius crinis-equi TaxID=585013 RepID=A0ABR3EYP8_9AGAR